MFAIHFLVLGMSFLNVTIAQVPQQLFSPLIPQKVLTAFGALPKPIQYPQYTDNAGKWLFFPPTTWTSGFYPSTLYALNTRKALCGVTQANDLGSADWVTLARSASRGLPLDASNGIGHDVGFISFPFVDELGLNPQNQTAIDAVNKLAAALAARFDPTVGCTRSWDTADPTDFTVIIDNMMNLELLFHSEGLTGNHNLRRIAVTHANTTMLNHVRPDGSTWHVVEYNSTTGRVIRKRTAQGFSDTSTWSRGQAWGIYGFANMYRLTKDLNYLNTSRRMATYFLNNIPRDGVIPWDFNAPLTPSPRPADSSAATIAANALLLLAQQERDQVAAKVWRDNAIQILSNVTKLAWKPQWQSLLSNGTVNEPANNLLTGIVYGDYYYIKAANDLITMGVTNCPMEESNSHIIYKNETFAVNRATAAKPACDIVGSVTPFMTTILD